MGMIINRRRVMGGKSEKMILATLTLTDDSIVVINGEGTLTADIVADYMSTCKYFVAGDKCTAIGDNVLLDCTTLKSVVLSDSVLDVGIRAFKNCSNIEYIDFGHGVRRLQWLAFYNSTSLKELHLPASISYTVSSDGFYNRKNLTTITVEDGCPVYDSRDDCNCVMQKSDNALAFGCVNSVIPNSCKIINVSAFQNVPITSITIPERVTTIYTYAFMGTKLTSITIPDSVTTIGAQVFQSTLLTEVTIGRGITSIGSYAFLCGRLYSVTILANNPPTINSNTFSNNATGRKIYVPAESVEAYKSAANWSTYAADIEAIPTT